MATKTIGAAAEILPGNANRKSLIIQNEDATNSVYLKRERGELLGVSSTDHDWLLGPGASLGLNWLSDGSQAIQARYTGIASAGTPRLAYFETEDIPR